MEELKPCDNCLKENLIDGPKSLIGKCGCDCIHQMEVGKHPWNGGVFKGSCTETLGWVCTVRIDEDDDGMGMFMDRRNCICEMYENTRPPSIGVKELEELMSEHDKLRSVQGAFFFNVLLDFIKQQTEGK